MQKVDVQMSPKPYDTKRLWCSQGDTGLRKFGFHLMDGIDEVDIANISDPVFSSFTEYEGGTEELLPTNTSTPSTSPILADIQYSDGLREDQSFTYRESPVTKDGKAKVNVLKGNTLVWNQIVQNGNFASKSVWRENVATYSVSNNEASFTMSQGSTGIYQVLAGVSGHKYLWWLDINTTGMALIGSANLGARYMVDSGFNSYQRITQIATANQNEITFVVYSATANATTIKVKNICVIDLTKLFGAGNEPTVDDFTSLFPLPYYQYDTGSLLSFKGEEIKTVGFNQWDEEWEVGWLNTVTGEPQESTSQIRSKNFIPILGDKTYFFNTANEYAWCMFYDGNKNVIENPTQAGHTTSNNAMNARNNTIIPPSNARYMKFYFTAGYGTTYKNDICINISSNENGKYEPYTTSTTSLPTLTYFPQGMNRVNDVYDELTQSKAVKRLGMVDLGTLNWTVSIGVTPTRFEASMPSNYKKPTNASERNHLICSKYEANLNVTGSNNETGITNYQNLNTVFVRDLTYSDATAFKTAMSGVMLVYELAEYEETPITTASLVTERTELPLYVSDGLLVADCTEDLSSDAGIFDAKIRFTDADGDCYSNKLKISVEARP